MRFSPNPEAIYGDCTQSELLAMCDRLRLCDTVRAHWVDLFTRVAQDDGTSKTGQRQRRDLDFFIAEARKA
jgi:hypothetical protein